MSCTEGATECHICAVEEASPMPHSDRVSVRAEIVYEVVDDDGWIIASIPEVPGVHSQGGTREEARANVIEALRGIREMRAGAEAR